MDKSQWLLDQGNKDIEKGDFVTWKRTIDSFDSFVEETILTFSDIEIIRRYPNASSTETKKSSEGS